MAKPVYAKVPGRVELLGNHTDYNNGLVLPAAISAYTTARGSYLNDGKMILRSATLNSKVELPLSILDKECPNGISKKIERDRVPDWVLYPLGVLYFLNRDVVEIQNGFSISYTNDLPLNTGLSSSASIEVATLNVMKQLFPFRMTLRAEALLCQQAENEVALARCGVMDQFSVLNGGVTFLDCKTLQYEKLHLPKGYDVIAVFDTGIKHSISGEEYAGRRKECQQAAKYFGVKSLREVPMSFLRGKIGLMPSTIYRRAFHVVTENNRVKRARSILRGSLLPKQRYEAMFNLMKASHESSRDYFENSCPELDVLAGLCWKHHLPAKLSGGGFGGSVVAIVKRGNEKVLDRIVAEYKKLIGTVPKKHIFDVVGGGYL